MALTLMLKSSTMVGIGEEEEGYEPSLKVSNE